MIKHYLSPIDRVVASITRLGSNNVVGALARGNCVVVAVRAQIGGLAVVQGYGKGAPTGTGGMTAFAQVRS